MSADGGPFVPLWRVEGHLDDIIRLEVAGLFTGSASYSHSTGAAFRLAATTPRRNAPPGRRFTFR